MIEQAPRDEVFREEKDVVADFRFTVEVAGVFDDMVARSVPFYAEIQRMIGEMAADIVTPSRCVYDLGCSTGTTMLALDPAVPRDAMFVGIDNSEEMLVKCREKLHRFGFKRPIEIQYLDLNQGMKIENASLALMVTARGYLRRAARQRRADPRREGARRGLALQPTVHQVLL